MQGRSSLVVAAIVSFVVPASVSAQEEGNAGGDGSCGIVTMCSGGAHRIDGPTSGEVQGPHQGCRTCLVDFSECHPSCGVGFLDPSLSRTYAMVVAAAAKGDLRAVLQLAPILPSHVVVNYGRMAVQVRSCSSREIVASLPLSGDGVALARMTASTVMQGGDTVHPGGALAAAELLRTPRGVPLRVK